MTSIEAITKNLIAFIEQNKTTFTAKQIHGFITSIYSIQNLHMNELKKKEINLINKIELLSNKVDNLSKIIEKQTETLNNNNKEL